MSDLISREAAIDAFRKNLCALETESDREYGISFSGVERILKSLPSAQSEIIACGDCIHWIRHDRRCGYWNHGVKPLDWCCHAERRTDEAD